MADLDVRYSALRPLIDPFKAKARTESRAFLAWYLENVYRLESTAAQDTVCDGDDDKGIDGLYVDNLNSRIDVFQARLVQNDSRTLGDTQLKEFAGTLTQLSTPDAVRELAQSTGNLELRKALEDNLVASLVEDGWEVRGVFLTNARADANAAAYLNSSKVNIVVADGEAIIRSYVPSGHIAIVSEPTTFDIFGYDMARYHVGSTNVITVPLKATELVQMKGIDSGALFDYNVRQFLGNTAVNKDIVKSVRNQAEHSNFLLYHNGVTIVARWVIVDGGNKLTINHYIVVNGCQSLSVFWEQRAHLSSDLRILARIIQIDPSSELLGTITHHSNNQNGIKPRDFQSNSPMQLRLRNEFERDYAGTVFYRISRGEQSELPEIIDNELAARMLLAFDLEEPWTSHQTYKLFDELHSKIFARPEVDANRIVALFDIYRVVEDELNEVDNELLAKYTLTKFFLVYLIREALNGDPTGQSFVANPRSFVLPDRKREILRRAVAGVLRDLIVDLNGEVQEREDAGTPFDFKRDLKSESAVRGLARQILGPYTKAIKRDRAPSFTALYEQAGRQALEGSA